MSTSDESPVLLTAIWLSKQCHKDFYWRAGIIVEKAGSETELDIVACDSNRIFVAECKDNIRNTPVDISKLEEQLANGEKISKDIGGEQFILTTLYPELVPLELRDLDCLRAIRNNGWR